MATDKLRRNTPQRKVVLEELCQLKTHPTAAELYAVVRRRLPRISLGTVYRNLEVLHEDGKIHKMEYAGAESRFDGNTDRHDHVRCTGCGRIDDLFPLESQPEPSFPVEMAGFLVTGYRLEYQGTCPSCRNQETIPHLHDNPTH